MGGSAKKVVGVAIAVAVPFVAPKIVGALAASSMVSGTALGAALSTTAGATVGSALVGAGLGAAGAAVTGGDVRQGALMGGIGGGFGGYGAASQAAQAQQATQAGAGGFNLGDVMAGGTGTGAAAPALYTPVPAAQPAFSLSNVMAGGTGFEATPQLFSSAPAAAAPAGGSFTEALKGLPGEIAGRFTSSEALADMTLRAGASLLTGQLAGDGLSEEEQQLLQAQMADLQALREQDEELFKTRLQEAMGLLGEARYFDPAQFGMQAQTAVKVAGAQQQREVERQAALRPGRAGMSAADQRRAGLDIAARGQTAYARGAESAQQQRMNTLQAGLAALPPSGPTAGLQYGQGLSNMYALADKRRREAQSDMGDWFGSITGTRKAESIG
jgi:osmotically inducible lipoprotein OsmB